MQLGAFLALRPALVERRRSAREVIELRSELAAERSVLDERLAAAVKTLSSEALDANSARFLELADARLSGYVRPLKDSLERMDRQLQSVERVRQEAYGKLTESVSLLRATRSPPQRDRKPRQRPARSARPRSLGRDPAAKRSSRWRG